MQLKFRSSSSSGAGVRSKGGRGCLTVFFLVFLLMGAGFTVAILAETVSQTMVWFWPEHPCTIVACGVEETGDESEPYRPSVEFEYEIDGRSYRGTALSRGSTATASYDKARRPSDRYPIGATTTCRVDPDHPSRAVLERTLPLIGFVAILPLIFVAVGAGGIYWLWRGGTAAGGDERTTSISQRATRGGGHAIGIVVGLIFVAVGGALSVFLLVIPVSRLAMSFNWVETPAVVVESTVRSWSTDDGTSYRADVLYQYEADGRSWRSNRRSFFPLSSGDYDDQRSVIDRYPMGAEIVCFVHPGDPTRSVLSHRPSAIYLIGLFPLLFLLAGLAVVRHSAGKMRSEKPPVAGVADPVPEASVGSRTLEPEAGPIAKVVGMLFVAAFWNGIVSVFVWQAVKGWLQGNPEWFLMIFLIPFLVVGFGLIFGVFYFLLAVANPRPGITITPGSPRLGTRLHVDWSFTGEAGRIQHLKIVLEGHEQASYRRGTDTHTDREAFASLTVADTGTEWEIAQGSADVEIPEDTMHSFSSDNNAVVWALYVHGDIARWPDLLETFEIDVRPLARDRLLP